jgi:hypothetical protein
MSEHDWHRAQPYPWSSVVGCGVMLLNQSGACVGHLCIRGLGKDDAVKLSEQMADMMNSHRHVIAALVVAQAAIAPDDLGGISLQDWNKRLKSANKIIARALKRAAGKGTTNMGCRDDTPEPCTEEAIEQGCKCWIPMGGYPDIDPPEPRRHPHCPLHGKFKDA